MSVKKYTIYSVINPHHKKEVSARKRKEYLKCKFWKNTQQEAWVFFYCYFPPVASQSLCRLLLILSGRLFKSKGFEEAIKTAWSLSEQKIWNKLDIASVDDPEYKKIIKALDTPYPRDSSLDDILLWAKDTKLITHTQACSLSKKVASINSCVSNYTSEAVVQDTLRLFIEKPICDLLLYHDAQQLLFPSHDLFDELKTLAYYSSNGEHFYFKTRLLMKWLMQQGYLSEQLTEMFRSIKVESIKESLIPYKGRFDSLQKLIQQGADRDDLLHEALQGKPLYWKYPIDCKCKRNMDNRCICNDGVRWEESKPWVKHEITAKQRLGGFGQLKKNESDDTFCCQFGGLVIDMLRHNKLPKTAINHHYRIELVPTEEESIYGLQPYIVISQNELVMAIADDRIGFLIDDVSTEKITQFINHDVKFQLEQSSVLLVGDIKNGDHHIHPKFKKHSKAYTLYYQGEEHSTSLALGFSLMQELILNPNILICSLDLIQRFNKVKNQEDMQINKQSVYELKEHGINVVTNQKDDALIDDRTKKEVCEKINDLKAQKQEALNLGNIKEAEKIDKDLEQYVQYITASLNQKGASRNNKTPADKARETVQKNISRALKELPMESRLLQYLKTTIKTGCNCIYIPSLH